MRSWRTHRRRAHRAARTAANPELGGRLAVFAPSPLLTVTIERGMDQPEVHLHAGGQGFWVARLAATLGAEVVLCCALGGEPGRVLRGLIESEPLTLRDIDAGTPNGVYVHDRRGGRREEIVSVESRALTRHASDGLYGIALGAGLDADVMLLTGSMPRNLVNPDLYRRLAGDLRAHGTLVIADLTGAPLHAALRGGVDLVRSSHHELVEGRLARGTSVPDLLRAARVLHAAGARHVVVSRAEEPALLVGECHHPDGCELIGPRFEALDHRGTGDSMFAATGVGLARGMDMLRALQLGMAAGALNATRRGLGSGTREEIERLAAHVTVRCPAQQEPPTTPPRATALTRRERHSREIADAEPNVDREGDPPRRAEAARRRFLEAKAHADAQRDRFGQSAGTYRRFLETKALIDAERKSAREPEARPVKSPRPCAPTGATSGPRRSLRSHPPHPSPPSRSDPPAR